MRVLVTGGHGFIGRYLLTSLCQKGHTVTVLDMQSRPPEFEEISYEHHEGDVLDRKWLKEVWPSKVDTVVHLVGLADAGVAQKEPDKSFWLNVLSLERVLEACREWGGGRVLLPSTAAVYGTTRDLPVTENVQPLPTNVYGWHKLMAEQLLKAYAQAYGLQYTVFRLFNVYGRGHKGVIDLALRKAHLRESLEVQGTGQLRDFVYAGDVVDAIVKVIEGDTGEHRVINIGSGQGMPIQRVLSLVNELYPHLRIIHRDGLTTGYYDSQADITLATSLLDWSPSAGTEFMKKVIKREMIYDD